MPDSHRTYTLFPSENFQQHPWKNGLGITTELLVSGNESAEFDWRLSIAQVAEDGMFSDFTGLQRQLFLLEGNGIELDFNQRQKAVLNNRFEVADFDGGWPTQARLLDGPIKDFNIMTRRGICQANVFSSLKSSGQSMSVKGDLFLIYCPDELIEITSTTTDTYQIPSQNLLRIDGVRGSEFRIESGSFIAIDIQFNG
jgi:uncharacterized protein